MSLDELVSTFKQILLTPPEELSQESQKEFQNILKLTPSPILFKLRSLLEIMQNQVSPRNYKTYYSLLRSLLDTHESLSGRVSPDILEPLSEGYLSHTDILITSSEKVEITTGTSIWALFLKKQLQEQNRVDQRHLKCVVILGLTVKNSLRRILSTGFWEIFHCGTEKKNLFMWIDPVKKLLKRRFLELYRELEKFPKKIEKLNQRLNWKISKIFKLFEKKLDACILRRLKSWHLSSVLRISRSCISPVLPEKKLSELKIKLNDTQGMISDKLEQLLRLALKKLEDVCKRTKFKTFYHINLFDTLCKSTEKIQEYKKQIKRQRLVKGVLDRLHLKYITTIQNALKKYKETVNYLNKRNHALKSVTGFLKFKLLKVLNAFSKNSFNKTLKSSMLYKKLHNLSINYQRKYFFMILNFHEVLLKKGFDIFVHNSYIKNIEKINKTWRGKLLNSESKWKDKFKLEESRFKASNFFSRFCKDYSERLLRFSVQKLKKC